MIEKDPLAAKYHDLSVAEQRSLSIAFDELLKEDYDDLRYVMFPFTFSGDEYCRFRDAVVQLVLATDISSKERSEITKKKWDLAFGGLPKKVTKRYPSKLTRHKAPFKTPALKPPKDHPMPNRQRKQLVKRLDEQRNLKKKESLEFWTELGGTPVSASPQDGGSSMNDSLMFFWFCPTSDSEHGEQTASSDREEMSDSFTLSQELTERNNFDVDDLEKSIALIPDLADNASDRPEFQDCYPHESQLLQWSCSTFDRDESHHLLSPKKVSRLNKLGSRGSTDVSADRTPKPAYRQLNRSIIGQSSITAQKRVLTAFSKRRIEECSFGELDSDKGSKTTTIPQVVILNLPNKPNKDITLNVGMNDDRGQGKATGFLSRLSLGMSRNAKSCSKPSLMTELTASKNRAIDSMSAATSLDVTTDHSSNCSSSRIRFDANDLEESKHNKRVEYEDNSGRHVA